VRACAYLRRRREEDERGFTLVEMLISVWIVGAVMTAMMGALITMSRASDIENRTTIAETELRHYSEIVRGLSYKPCATAAYYKAQADALYAATKPTSPVITPSINANVLYWNQSADPAAALPTTFVTSHPTCDGTPGQTDDGLQKLAIGMSVGSAPTITLPPLTITKRDNLEH
jgi:prepilin-type N-terminal cleavage/methylation domain-containing protein